MYSDPEDRPARGGYLRTLDGGCDLYAIPNPRAETRELTQAFADSVGVFSENVENRAGAVFVMWDENGVISSGFQIGQFSPYQAHAIPDMVRNCLSRDLGVA